MNTQYNTSPKTVLHDAIRGTSFDFFKNQKPTSNFIKGQDHTKVANILEAQKMPFLDRKSQPFSFEMKTLPRNLLMQAAIAHDYQDSLEKK